MIGLLVVVFLATASQAQYLDECPPESVEIAEYRYMTRDLPPLTIPNVARMEKDRIYAVAEIQEALDGVDLAAQIQLPTPFNTDPFVERCCDDAVAYNCSSQIIDLRFVKYQGDVCWIVYPALPFVTAYTRCTCCACVLDDLCPVVGRCVETDYRTAKVIAYCPHIMYSSRYQKLAIRIPTACECTARCPVPQTYFYKKIEW